MELCQPTTACRPQDNSRKAFTLIELLVVIAIIAVLTGILMPSLRAAREAARGAVCLSNLRQLSVAWTLYGDGNDARKVGAQVMAGQWGQDNWVHRRVQSGDPGFAPDMSAHEVSPTGFTGLTDEITINSHPMRRSQK